MRQTFQRAGQRAGPCGARPRLFQYVSGTCAIACCTITEATHSRKEMRRKCRDTVATVSDPLAQDIRVRRCHTLEKTMTKMLQAQPGYAALLKDIKERVRTAQVRASLAVNHELILLYWSIGRDTVHWRPIYIVIRYKYEYSRDDFRRPRPACILADFRYELRLFPALQRVRSDRRRVAAPAASTTSAGCRGSRSSSSHHRICRRASRPEAQ